MKLKKKSFFERLTGSIRFDDDADFLKDEEPKPKAEVTINPISKLKEENPTWKEEEEQEGQLTVDVYQTPGEIVVQTMAAGCRPEDLTITITRDMITIKGRREENKTINDDDYFVRELYWGAFSRTILLPQEVEPDSAEAIERHGLLIIRIPKIDKSRKTTLKVKSL